MADRHPYGCDPESFRSLPTPLSAARQPIPRRQRPMTGGQLLPSFANQPPHSQRSCRQRSSGGFSYPVARREYDRRLPMPGPRSRFSGALLNPAQRSNSVNSQSLQFPGLHTAISETCRLARKMTSPTPPQRTFDACCNHLIETFISFIEAERKVLCHQRYHARSRPVRKGHSDRSQTKKRGRTIDEDYCPELPDAFAERSRVEGPLRTKRRTAGSFAVESEGNRSSERMSVRVNLPRRSKEKSIKLVEEDTEESVSDESSVDIVLPTKPVNARNVPVLRTADDREINSSSDDERQIQAKMFPRTFVWERAICSDFMSQTPHGPCDEDETDLEVYRKPKSRRSGSRITADGLKNTRQARKPSASTLPHGIPLSNRRLTRNESLVLIDPYRTVASDTVPSDAFGGKDAKRCLVVPLANITVLEQREKGVLQQKLINKWEPGAALRRAQDAVRQKGANVEKHAEHTPNAAECPSSTVGLSLKNVNGKVEIDRLPRHHLTPGVTENAPLGSTTSGRRLPQRDPIQRVVNKGSEKIALLDSKRPRVDMSKPKSQTTREQLAFVKVTSLTSRPALAGAKSLDMANTQLRSQPVCAGEALPSSASKPGGVVCATTAVPEPTVGASKAVGFVLDANTAAATTKLDTVRGNSVHLSAVKRTSANAPQVLQNASDEGTETAIRASRIPLPAPRRIDSNLRLSPVASSAAITAPSKGTEGGNRDPLDQGQSTGYLPLPGRYNSQASASGVGIVRSPDRLGPRHGTWHQNGMARDVRNWEQRSYSDNAMRGSHPSDKPNLRCTGLYVRHRPDVPGSDIATETRHNGPSDASVLNPRKQEIERKPRHGSVTKLASAGTPPNGMFRSVSDLQPSSFAVPSGFTGIQPQISSVPLLPGQISGAVNHALIPSVGSPAVLFPQYMIATQNTVTGLPVSMGQVPQQLNAPQLQLSQLPPEVQKHYQDQYKEQYWAEMNRVDSDAKSKRS